VKRQAPFLVIVNGPIRRPGTQIPVERVIDELGVMLAERFPDQEFVFAEGEKIGLAEGKERRPSSAVVVVPIVGTLGEAGRDPSRDPDEITMLEHPPEELRRAISEAVHTFHFPDEAWESV
jgi:hypothetical protein